MPLARKGHWPMQLLAYGSFRQSSVLTLHVVYHEGTNKHSQMQKVDFEIPKPADIRSYRELDAWEPAQAAPRLIC